MSLPSCCTNCGYNNTATGRKSSWNFSVSLQSHQSIPQMNRFGGALHLEGVRTSGTQAIGSRQPRFRNAPPTPGSTGGAAEAAPLRVGGYKKPDFPPVGTAPNTSRCPGRPPGQEARFLIWGDLCLPLRGERTSSSDGPPPPRASSRNRKLYLLS